MFVTIDIGNSHPHVGLFDGVGTLKEVISFDEYLEQMGDRNDIVMTSQVGSEESNFEHLPEFTGGCYLGMPVNYTETLGIDRLIQAWHLFQRYKHLDKFKVLLIDIGTFIKIDVITECGFQGGVISPGPQILLDTYSRRGYLLPQFTATKVDEVNGVVHNTEDAIRNGANLMYEGLYRQYFNIAKNADEVMVTGGGAYLHLDFIEKCYQAPVSNEPHLIHYSLFEALRYLQKRGSMS